jgi:carbonic anhydrase
MSSIPPVSEVLQNLTDGNFRFFTGTQRHPNQSPARRSEIAEHQEPFAAVLTCADSRIAPEIIFDQGLGDLFVVRVAANVADPMAIETLELAVKKIGIGTVLVLGHTRCAAVTAAVKSRQDEVQSPMRRAPNSGNQGCPPDER